MSVPWSGFPMAKLVEMARPLSSAKYVRMETFMDPKTAPGQRQRWHPWPYIEGLTIAEATNELTFMVTGAYGKPVPKSMGAPIRLAVPWKYGFKSVKSIVRFTFTDQRPKSFWEALQSSEYGFWANVNPQIAHPRWSQATEEIIGTNELTFMVTGAYGKPVPKSMGAPIRLAAPWKYGFKSVKSIVRFTFTDQRPKSFWEALQASEYGFWANVNPQVAHPRWSQATEEVIGTNERKPTLLFNGYGEYVAGMYKGLEKERLWA